MKKKILSLFIVTALLFSLASCGSDEDSGNREQAGGQDTEAENLVRTSYDLVQVAAEEVPESLEPDLSESDPGFYMLELIYEPLFDYSEGSGDLLPCLASGYTKTGDRQWKVELQDDIYDWEGNHLTADDVAFCFEWKLEQGIDSGYDCFDSIEVIDTYSFYINWTDDIEDLTDAEKPLTQTFIFSETAYEEKGNFASSPVGTGCYKILEFTPGEELSLEANTEYWALSYLGAMADRHTAKVEMLTFRKMTEEEAVEGLKGETVDICGYVSIADAAQFEEASEEDQYLVDTIVEDGYWYLGANTKNVNKNLRNALFYGLKDDEIAASMGGDYETLNAFATTGQSDWSDSLLMSDTYVAGDDEELAEKYLDDSEYDGSTLELVCPNSMIAVQAARNILEQAAQMGIKIEITAVPESRYTVIVNAEETRNWDLALGYVQDETALDAWSQLLQNNDGGNILYLAEDATLNKMYRSLAGIENETDSEEGNESQGESDDDSEQIDADPKSLQNYIADNAYLYPVAVREQHIVCKAQVGELLLQDESSEHSKESESEEESEEE